MSGIATAVVGAGALGYLGAKESASASKEAAGISAQSQMAQLDYLKEINKLPQQYKEAALTRLNNLYGSGSEGDIAQSEMINRAKTSPLYSEIMGGLKLGEDAILRNASATGGLRSGNAQSALADYSTRLSNQALLTAYNDQLGGLNRLAGLSTNENAIGQTMANIGSTQAAGVIGAGQAMQAGYNNLGNTLLTGLGLGIKAGLI